MADDPVSIMESSPAPMLSVVVPVFNEQENLPELIRRASAALGTVTPDWELVLVDDGSHDESPALIRAAHAADPRYRAELLL